MNTPERLNEEDLADLLARPAGAGSSEADALRAALASYRTETLHWAERRSSTQPSLRAAARRSRMWAAVPQWSLAAVAVISIAAGAAHVYERPAVDDQSEEIAATIPDAGSAGEQRTSPAQIADDNRLLSSIDQTLSYHHAESAIEHLGLKPAQPSKSESAGLPE